MNIYGFAVTSLDYPDLYKDVLNIDWDSTTNIVNITFADSNKNYLTLINMFSERIKHSINVDVLSGDVVIRYYSMELLPMKYTQSPLSITGDIIVYIKASFKILKSEVNFVESVGE